MRIYEVKFTTDRLTAYQFTLDATRRVICRDARVVWDGKDEVVQQYGVWYYPTWDVVEKVTGGLKPVAYDMLLDLIDASPVYEDTNNESVVDPLPGSSYRSERP